MNKPTYTLKFVREYSSGAGDKFWRSSRGWECFVDYLGAASPTSRPYQTKDINGAYGLLAHFSVNHARQWYYLVEELNPEEIMVS